MNQTAHVACNFNGRFENEGLTSQGHSQSRTL